MISDVLSDAIHQIEQYVRDNPAHMYDDFQLGGKAYFKYRCTLLEMTSLLRYLDKVPEKHADGQARGGPAPAKRKAKDKGAKSRLDARGLYVDPTQWQAGKTST